MINACCLASRSRIFHFIDVTITNDQLQNLDPFWGACGFNLEQEGSLQSRTCYDTRPPFMCSYPRKEIPRLVGTNNKPRVMRTYMYSLQETPFNYFKWRTKSFSKGDTENTLSRLKIFWGIAKSIQWNMENAYVQSCIFL